MPSRRPERQRALTEKERRFIDAYFTEPTAEAAYIKAGYSAKTAAQGVSRFLKHPRIAAAIRKRQKVLASRNIATAERVIEEHAKIAFATITDVVSWDAASVTVTASTDIKPEAAAAIAEVEMVDDGVKARVRVKMHGKTAALDALSRHFGIYNDKLRIDGNLLDQVRAFMESPDVGDEPDDDDAV